jgi:hypothetical protein
MMEASEIHSLVEAQTRRAIAGDTGRAGGEQILEMARTRLGEKYVLGARAPLSNADWHGPWDCAEFTSWCVYQVTGVVYGARPSDNTMAADPFTGYWADDAEELGDIVSIDIAKATPGAMLLRAPSGSRGGHIAISDGRSGTVEAHSSKRGVTEHTAEDRRWDYGVLIPGVSYTTQVPDITDDDSTIWMVTDPMMRGDGIAECQRKLNDLGFDVGTADGIYGGQMEAAVIQFQASKGLVADGECGPDTRDKIRRAKLPKRRP